MEKYPLDKAHTFAEPKVEAAVRAKLGKETGMITYGDLLKVTELTVFQRHISDASDFRHMTNLRYNNITDFSPLLISGMKNLRKLTPEKQLG